MIFITFYFGHWRYVVARKTFDTLPVHKGPDVDTGLCVWLLRNRGTKHFPGIDKAKVIGWNAGPAPDFEGKKCDASKWRTDKGVLPVDVGHGILDHHNPELKENNKSSADLVAGYIGVLLDGSLQNLLEFCRMQDSTGKGYNTNGDDNARMISLINTINGWNLLYPDDPGKVIDLICDALDGIYAMEKDWFQAQKDIRGVKSKKVRIGRENYLVIFVVSATRLVEKLMREKARKEKMNAICIIDNPVLKQTRTIGPRHIDLKWVALHLRVLDAWHNNVKLSQEQCRIDHLTAPGTLPEIPAFHFAFQNVILNRSPKNPDAPRMKIHSEHLLDIVTEAVENRLPGDMPCSKDLSCPRERCPFYSIGLNVCKEYRHQRWLDFQARKTAEEEETGTPDLKLVEKKEVPETDQEKGGGVVSA